MAEAFKEGGKPETKETERFIRMFDKFFDVVNVRSSLQKEGRSKAIQEDY